jgi:flagellar basal-body rod protein FlgF
MLVAQSQADVIANNLANVNTNGFKQTLLQVQSAPSLDVYRMQNDPGTTGGKAVPGVAVDSYVGSLGTGALVYDTPNAYAQGPLEQTGNPLDMAISGSNGFFAVGTGQGVRYTRDGQFLRDGNGQLATQDGDPVLGTNGQPITVPTGPFTVGTDGTITQNGVNVGQIQVVQFANLVALRPQGDNFFQNTGNAGPSPATGASVQQGSLEKSTTNVVQSMVDLISAERWFETNQKMVQTQDDATELAISSVGKTQHA